MQVARIKDEPTTLLQIDFFGKCCRRAQIQKLSPMQSKILVLLLQGYIEHDVYFWQRYVIEWFLGSNHCSNNEQKVATQNDGGSRLIFLIHSIS